MRVLLISDRYPPEGGERVEPLVRALADELAGTGHAVGVIARRPGPAPPAPLVYRERRDGVPLYWLAGGEAGSPGHRERLERLFAMALSELGPDVVHLVETQEALTYGRLARDQGVAVVVTADNVCPDGHAGAALAAERVVCASRWAATRAYESGVEPARLHVVTDGIAIDTRVREARRGSARAEPGSMAVACIGALERRSEQEVLLEALASASLGRIRVALLGPVADVSYARALRRLAASTEGLELRLFGSFAPVQLPGVLATVDCAVFPSRYQGPSSVSVREALACGTPVVVARSGAATEAVVDGANGLMFDPDRPAELTALLQALGKGGEVLGRLRAGARASPVVTAHDHAAALRGVYEEARSGG